MPSLPDSVTPPAKSAVPAKLPAERPVAHANHLAPTKTVVSFVRRSPRMNPSQRAAFDDEMARFAIEVPRGQLETSIAPGAAVDLDAAFGRKVGPGGAELIVEIGCGAGDSLTPMAAARPDAAVLAFEVYQRAVGSTFSRLRAAGTDNVRLIIADGAAALAQLIAPGSLSQLWTFFPDPWPKKRHHKRRLVSPEFAAVVTDRLALGGIWWLATDWADYADHMRKVLDVAPGLVNVGDLPGGWASRADRPVTKFEARGLDAGRVIRDLRYQKVNP